CSPESISSLLNNFVHLVEMIQFFLCNGKKFCDNFRIFRKHGNKRNGIGSCFLLTPGVIRQNFFYVSFCNIGPPWISREFQLKHDLKFSVNLKQIDISKKIYYYL